MKANDTDFFNYVVGMKNARDYFLGSYTRAKGS